MDAQSHAASERSSEETAIAVGEARTEVTALRTELLDVSHRIHAQPELRFQERVAAALIGDLLSEKGFDLTSPVADMPTAFVARRRFGTGGPTVGVFCEYDALEGIGHACGHNIIAAAGAGAGIAAAAVLQRRTDIEGQILVIGSPAEEGGGGKVRLIDSGILDELDAAVMVHPAGFDAVERPNLGRLSLNVEFTGRASHAAAAPQEGLNALDAATLFLVAIGLLRQQLRSDSRVHAIVTKGGDAVNVIPERSELAVFVRSSDLSYLRARLEPAARACADGAALATGTSATVKEVAPAYEPIQSNPVLAALAADAFDLVGRTPSDTPTAAGSAGSTDMGNVSQMIPAIHPYICVAPGLSIHTRDFAHAAGSDAGDRAALDGAIILAAMLVKMLDDPQVLPAARRAFEGPVGRRRPAG